MTRLSRFDDFPIQQTAEPVAYLATSDRNAYGRYWFNGFDPDGAFYFGIAFGIYPHREVMDCALSLVLADGTQHSFRASRRLRGDRTDMHVGPLTLSIQEPMRCLRVAIEQNETGISADLTFHARSPAHAEPMDRMRQGIRTTMQSTRYTQFGNWGGYIRAGDRTVEVDVSRVRGTRDRSWGWRPAGEPEGGVSAPIPEQVFWMWAPIQWADRATHYGLYEHANGVRWKEFAHIFPLHPLGSDFDPLSPAGFREALAGEHRLTFQKGSRFAGPSEIDIVEQGRTTTIRLEPLLRFPMFGIGYTHPSWGHGFYKGEEAIAADSCNVHELDPSSPHHQHVQTVVRATIGDEVGHGVLEQAIFGPHDRYGLKGFTDGV
jgi:hypothetical protein